MAQAASACHQLPIEMGLLGVLGILASGIPRNFLLKGAANGHESHGNLFVVISAPRSAGKSSIIRPLIEPLHLRQKELLEDHAKNVKSKCRAQIEILEREKSKLLGMLGRLATATKPDRFVVNLEEGQDRDERLARIFGEIQELEDQIESEPALWVGNHTSEKLSSILKGNGEQCLIYATEGAEVFRVMAGKYASDGKASFDLYLSGFSVEPMNISRVGRGSITITPCLSMLLFVQPSVLKEVLENKEAAERGMFARTIAVDLQVSLKEDDGVAREIDPDTQRDWNKLVTDLLDKRDEARVITCTSEAREIFRAYHNETVGWRLGELSSNEADLGRAREIAIRIALILALAEDPESMEVTEEIAKRAVAIGRWCALTTHALSNKTRTEITRERLERLIRLVDDANGNLALRELEKSHNFLKEDVLSLIAGSSGKLILGEHKGERGRPSPVVVLVEDPKSGN
jgi:hypothetical protein